MQRLNPKASSVLEKQIFKGFYHIWAWRPPWSINCDHFSNLSFPQPKEAPYEMCAKLAQSLQRRRFLNVFPKQMHREANLYDYYFSNFGRPPVPDDLSKDSGPRFWRRRFLKVFTIYGHGGHLGQ